jgi:hypothetical protein
MCANGGSRATPLCSPQRSNARGAADGLRLLNDSKQPLPGFGRGLCFILLQHAESLGVLKSSQGSGCWRVLNQNGLNPAGECPTDTVIGRALGIERLRAYLPTRYPPLSIIEVPWYVATDDDSPKQ